MKKYLLPLVVMGILSKPAASEQPDCRLTQQAQTYCDLSSPPKDAYPIESHGYFIFVYPRIIPDYFSGCQTVWVETGEKLWVTRFKNSEPISRESYTDEGESIFCEIKDKEYMKDGKVCLSREGVIRGLKAVLPVKPDPVVPSERDPRKKED